MAAQAAKQRPAPPQRTARTPFKYQTPKDWESKPPRDEFTAVLFEVANQDQLATVTLTSLSGEGGRNLAFNIQSLAESK